MLHFFGHFGNARAALFYGCFLIFKVLANPFGKFLLRSYNFLHNAPPSLGAIAAHPRFPLRRGTFFRSPSPPYAHPNSQTLDQRKKTVHFLDKCVHIRRILHSFFLPSRHHSFPLPPPLARVGARARTRTQRVFDFCLHRTTIRAQPTENKWIAREAFTLPPTRYFEHNSL